jgi:class 3 adenylate cyclase
MTAAGLLCGSCGTELSEKAKSCSECGAAVTSAAQPAEYKQVTVLFADVARSMDIASAVGPERLREIMADLANRSAAVVQRYGGTVDKFTPDGIMAVFGARRHAATTAGRAVRAYRVNVARTASQKSWCHPQGLTCTLRRVENCSSSRASR